MPVPVIMYLIMKKVNKRIKEKKNILLTVLKQHDNFHKNVYADSYLPEKWNTYYALPLPSMHSIHEYINTDRKYRKKENSIAH
jgi:hypothetical protein